MIHLPAMVSRNLFTGRNLYLWRRFIERTLRPQKLEGHLTNPRPNEDDAHYFKWINEEHVLFTWLLDSMKPDINDQFIDHESVKDKWDEVTRLYSKLEDESRMADLNKKAMQLLQEHLSVLEYSNELRALWKEIDFYRPLLTDSTSCEYASKGRTYGFLTGLRPEFETVSFLFNRENPLSFNESVVEVIKEEGRLMSMNVLPTAESQTCTLKFHSTSTFGQASNIGSTQSFNTKPSSNQESYQKKFHSRKKGDSKDSLWCDFCQLHMHTRETYWKIHG